MSLLWTVVRASLVRWQFWLVLGFLLAQLIGFAAMTGARRIGPNALLNLYMGILYTVVAIAVQAKEHLAVYRAALAPGFRKPHLLATGIWLAIAVVPFPVVAAAAGASVWGVVGITLFVAAATFAGACRGGWRASIPFGGCVVIFLPPVRRAAASILAGEEPLAATVLAVAGVWFLVETMRYLLTMDEETPGYDVQFRGNLRQLSGPQARRSMFAAFRRLDREKSIWLRLADARLPEVMPPLGDSRWARLRHWRRATPNTWASMLLAGLVWIVMLIVMSAMTRAHTHLGPLVHGSVWILFLLPQMAAVQAWQTRAGMIGRELTYPVHRRDLVLELGASALLSVLMSWAFLALTMVATLALLAGPVGGLAGDAPQPMPWRTVAIALMASGPWHLVAFAVGADRKSVV